MEAASHSGVGGGKWRFFVIYWLSLNTQRSELLNPCVHQTMNHAIIFSSDLAHIKMNALQFHVISEVQICRTVVL